MRKSLSIIVGLCLIALLCSCSEATYSNTTEQPQKAPISNNAADYSVTSTIDTEEVEDYLLPLQGEWKSTKSNWHLIIKRNNIDAMYYENYGDIVEEENHNQYSIDHMDSEGRYIVETFSKTYFYHINDAGLLECSNNLDGIVNTYQKVSENTELPEFNVKKEPFIGMSAAELENSTWGRPSKRNKTTTANGTTEQWIYDKPFNSKAYIYITNGYVTAIQER